MKAYTLEEGALKISIRMKEVEGENEAETLVEVAATRTPGDFGTGFIILDSPKELLTLKKALDRYIDHLNLKTD